MKKATFIIVLMLNQIIGQINTIQLTFNLDMSYIGGGSTEGVFIAGGSEFGWPGDYPMLDNDGDGIYTATIIKEMNGESHYTFINGDCGWECKENITGQYCSDPSNWNDRFISWGENDITIDACFGLCGDSTCDTIEEPFDINVTFSVDMNNENTHPEGVYIAGGALGQEGYLMEDLDGDDIWTITLPLGAYSTHYYKFRNQPSYGTWEGFENTQELISGGCVMGQYNDRYVNTNGNDIILPIVNYGSCFHNNENPTDIEVTFSVDMNNENTHPQGVYLAGGSFGQEGYLMDDSDGDNIWSIVLLLESNQLYLYKYRNQPSYGTWDGFENSENLQSGGCVMGLYNDRYLNTGDSNITLPVVSYGSCTHDNNGPTPTFPLGSENWKLMPIAGSLHVGPGDGSTWWSNTLNDVENRSCYFDDEYIFSSDGSFFNDQGGETWIEPWQDSVDQEGCGSPIYPHNGTNPATWTIDENTITVTGLGAYIGLAKAHNTGEDGIPNGPITYNYTISNNGQNMTIKLWFGSGEWTFKLATVESLETDLCGDIICNDNEECIDNQCVENTHINLTFNLDLSYINNEPQENVFIAGGDEFGIPGDYQMIDDDGDGIYTITISKPINGFSYYTYINGDCNWACKENIAGQECSNPNNWNDRFLEWGNEDMVINECFGLCGSGNCDEVPPLFGYDGLNLPIVYIDTYGETIVDDPRIPAFMGIIDNGNELNFLDDEYNDYEGLITIELRGNSSQYNPKKPYRIETVDENGENNNVSLLGLPEENDWILYPPYQDKSLMRNVLTYKLSNDMNQYASRTKFCELFINDEYKGIYVLMEKIKRDRNRVNISKLNSDDISGDDLTGGYILKFDWPWTGENNGGFESGVDGKRYNYHYPKPDDIAPEQENYISQFINDFENIMLSENYNDPEIGYFSLLNIESFIDYILLQELSKNVDAYRLSTYIYKDKESIDNRIYAGPIWDINHGYGNCNYGETWLTEGWLLEYNPEGGDQISFWWELLWNDTNFQTLFSERYQDLRSTIFSDNYINGIVDSITTHLGPSIDRNFSRWPLLGNYTWPNYYVFDSYEEEISYLKSWTSERLRWMDSELSTQITGDINLDGSVNVVDVVMVVNMILGLSTLDLIADMNSDNLVNIVDVIQIVNIIILEISNDASYAEFYISNNSLLMDTDGYIGAIEITLLHDTDFEIQLNKNSMVSKHVTNDNTTNIVIVKPNGNELFKTNNNYEIKEIYASNSQSLVNVYYPNEFILDQIYPNPFNAKTNIGYTLPQNMNVKIDIYDINGRNVITLFNGIKTSGKHFTVWNAENMHSGIYFIRLTAEKFTETKKIMLIK